MPKPGIDQLLIASALNADLRRRLKESPDQAFQDFDLTEEQKDILRHPDHRLLGLLGSALARQSPSSPAPPEAPAPHAVIQAKNLPDISLALTVVPCAREENGQTRFSYAVWVSPLPEGADPATIPPPAGAAFPGRPHAALYATIQVAAIEMQDTTGSPVVGLSASLRRSTNMSAPPPPEAAGEPDESPFASNFNAPEVQAAVAAVRAASSEQRYDRLIDLLHTLRSGEVV